MREKRNEKEERLACHIQQKTNERETEREHEPYEKRNE